MFYIDGEMIENGSEIYIDDVKVDKDMYLNDSVLYYSESKKRYCGGLWKMNKTRPEAQSFSSELAAGIGRLPAETETIIFPSSCLLTTVVDALKSAGSSIKVGAQLVSGEMLGAYTGQDSAQQLKSCGVKYALIGHSEVRAHIYREDMSENASGDQNGELYKKMVAACIQAEVIPVYCMGEALAIRQSGKSTAFLQAQIDLLVSNLSTEEVQKLIFVYEPIWAIGSGLTITPSEAEERCRLMRERIREYKGAETADKIPILFAGTLRASNVEEILALPNVNGWMAGGVSLKPEFIEMVRKSIR